MRRISEVVKMSLCNNLLLLNLLLLLLLLLYKPCLYKVTRSE
jgi:hypothetical protein